MELTASAFNVLLEMTTVSNHKPLKSSVPSTIARPNGAVKQPSTTKPTLHYSNGHQSKVVSHEELLQIICATPQTKHLVWTKGYKSWRSWKEIKSLKQAVESNLQLKQDLTQTQVKKAKSPQMTVTHDSGSSQKSAPKRSIAPSSSTKSSKNEQRNDHSSKSNLKPPHHKTKPAKAKHSFNYLSVPATIFTQFDVDLSTANSAIPFVGLDQSLQSGGLFLPTDRVLNIGDYLQVKVRIHEKLLLKFEAPVIWLRTKQEDSNLQHGVAVAWPKLTFKQLQIIEKATSSEQYEFFVA